MSTIIRGLAYPLTVLNGSLQLAEDADVVFQHILSVLETRPGDRVYRPSYGAPDYTLSGLPNVNVLAARIEVILRDRVVGLSQLVVSGTYDESGLATLTVSYALDGIPQPPAQFKLRL